MNRDIEILKEKMETVPVDVEGAIRAYGITLERTSLPKGVSGAISYENGQFKISVEKTDGVARQRFTAAHELAHYLLHGGLLSQRGVLNRHEDVLFETNGVENPSQPLSRDHEVEANKLAAAILMPASFVRKHYDPKTNNVAELASQLEVSKAALEIRLKNLGLKR